MNDQLRELNTGLNRQVLQIANNNVTTREILPGNSNHPLSCLSRIEFLGFNGEDVQGRIYRCEQFFGIDNTAKNLKVKIASIHLYEKALLWHQSFMKTRMRENELHRKNIRMLLPCSLDQKPFDDPLAELMKLRQLGSVEQYQENFDSLLTRVELPVNYVISYFLSGLRDEIQNAIRMLKPQTIHEAYCLRKLPEATLASIARRAKPILDRNLSYPKFGETSYKTPSQSSNSATQWANHSGHSYKSVAISSTGSATSIPKFVSKTLRPKDIDEKRAKNLCFLCDEKYFPGHKCRAQVYRLEVIEEEGVVWRKI